MASGNQAVARQMAAKRATKKRSPAKKATPRAPRTKKEPGVVKQVQEALKAKNRIATLVGFFLGGIVPAATYVVAHHEVAMQGWRTLLQPGVYLVMGGLLYSAKTVYDWGMMAFGMRVKAIGFVILLEGVMVTSLTGWLSLVALTYLVAINGIATGCTLALKK